MPASETSDSGAMYVYGVVASAPPLDATGVGDEPLQLIEHEGLAAVVSAFPAEDTRIRRRDLVAHLRTIEHVFAATTIAPCPFGTVLPSRDAVLAELLEPRAPELRDLLERLEGHVQMNIKAEYDEDGVLRRVLSEDAAVAQARERAQAAGDAGYYENIRLGELVSSAIATRRAADAAAIEARLAPAATATVLDPPSAELLVFKGSFLVERGSLAGFDAELDALARESDTIRFEATGPLPPVAFASLEGVGSWA